MTFRSKVMAIGFSLLSMINCSGSFTIAGKWSGKMVQPEGPRGSEGYTMRFQLSEVDSTVKGTSRIEIEETGYYAVMRLTGRVQRDTLFFTELEIIEQNARPGYGWCLKRGALRLSGDRGRLAGRWSTENCLPGEIDLARAD